MNYMKRNVFTKCDIPSQVGRTVKNPDKQPTTLKNDNQANYRNMMVDFLSTTPSSDKQSTISEISVRPDVTKTKEKSTSKRNTSHQVSESTRHNTASSDENVSYIMALSEGRGHARCEVGIAAININSPHLILCQLSDNLWYSGTLTKLNILNAIEILVPNTYLLPHSDSKLTKYIQTMYPKVKITPIPRRHFNESLGIEMIRKLCAPSHQNITMQISEKFYTLASAAALLNYLEFIKLIRFVPSTLKIEYQAKYGTMLIDVETSQRLELLNSLCNEKAPKSSLFGVLNYCVTAIGKRNLRAKILQPLCDIALIRSSHCCVRELLEKDELLFNLNGILKQFRQVDKLLHFAISVPQEDNVKAAEIMINQALLLKSCLENIETLYQILAETKSSGFLNIRRCLEDPRYNYLLEKINSILSNTSGSNSSSQYFQRLYAVKPKINNLLDESRKIYSNKVDEINEIVKELGALTKLPLRMMHTQSRGFYMQISLTKHQAVSTFPEEFEMISRNGCYVLLTTKKITALNFEIKEIIDMIQITSNGVVSKLLMDIRQEIDAIYHLTGFITELDIIQSLTTASKIGNYCEPTICESIKIKDGIHPLLEHNIDRIQCVPNNVVRIFEIAVPEYNFYLITGPNMGGKSIYIKMIAILQIMFQIGCFVPATSAEFRICDKLFSRIGLSDNIETGSSSFIVEMREMDYIIKNITANSLVIIDELCRSTNPEEGKILAWQICEKLIKMNGVLNDGKYYDDSTTDAEVEIQGNEVRHNLLNIGSPYIFVTTHFLELTKLSEQYYNVINLHLTAEEEMIDQEVHLKYLHKVDSGVTPITRYGMALARNVRFTCDILPRTEEILNEMSSNSTSNLNFGNITFNTTRDSVKITQIDKGFYDLTYNILSVLRNEDPMVNKLKQIEELLASYASTLSPEFVALIQNQTFDEIMNMTAANVTDESENKSSNIDVSGGDKDNATTKTSDLSYHSLKRRLALLESKEQKKTCADNVPNEFKKPHPITNQNLSTNFSNTIKKIPKVKKPLPVTEQNQVNQTLCKQNFQASSTHRVVEQKIASNSYQRNLSYSTRNCLNYKTNLPKNHNLSFMHNKTAHSMLNMFLEELSNSKQTMDSNVTQITDQWSDNDDLEMPDICNFSPEIDPDLNCSFNYSQDTRLSSSENRPSTSSNSSQMATSSNYLNKNELSYQTDLYLKNIFQNEMKKHSTYQTSKTKDNRIVKQSKGRPVEKLPQKLHEPNNVLSFFSKRDQSSTSKSNVTSLPNQTLSLPCFTARSDSRSYNSLPTSTTTLNDLRKHNSSCNLVTPSEFRSPILGSPTKSIGSTTSSSIICQPSFHNPMPSSIDSIKTRLVQSALFERKVTFNLDDFSQETIENPALLFDKTINYDADLCDLNSTENIESNKYDNNSIDEFLVPSSSSNLF